MNVAVLGLWHLGSVTAAATAAAGHRVRAWDPETSTVMGLEGGTPPIQEPGLADLLTQQIERGTLSVHRDRREALAPPERVARQAPAPDPQHAAILDRDSSCRLLLLRAKIDAITQQPIDDCLADILGSRGEPVSRSAIERGDLVCARKIRIVQRHHACPEGHGGAGALTPHPTTSDLSLIHI